MNKLVKIIIPLYNTELTVDEKHALDQCFLILSDYPKVFVKPESLQMNQLLKSYAGSEVESFKDSYFKNIEGYNRLMLSSEFYERFANTEYILIYQLDAFVFRDELKDWCSKGYDYIGAPWIGNPKHQHLLFRIFSPIKDGIKRIFSIQKRRPTKNNIQYKIGNGGFSLRRVQSFLNITNKEKELINIYLSPLSKKIRFIPEDVFWALEPFRKGYPFSVPDYKEALLFSFDKYPEACFAISKKVPFGCHAWGRKKAFTFWKKYINTQRTDA